MPNPQTAPFEEVVKYLTVTLKKQYGGDDEGQQQES